MLRAFSRRAPARTDPIEPTPDWLSWRWEQQLRGERLVGLFRGVIVAFNSGFWFLEPRSPASIPLLAHGVVGFAWAYVLADLWLTRRNPSLIRHFPYGSALLDLGFILLWIEATGGQESPFVPLLLPGAIALPLRVPTGVSLAGIAVYTCAFLFYRSVQPVHLVTAFYLVVTALLITSYAALLESRLRENVRDPLTASFSRSYGLFCLQRLLREGPFPFSVALIDLDRFKEVNDTFGHAAGDQALIECARVMTDQIRTQDILSRYGGDEFLLLLPGLQARTAFEVVERLRGAIEGLSVGVREVPARIRLTLSGGIAEGRPGDDTHHLLERADEALYRAKQERNQVAVHDGTHTA